MYTQYFNKQEYPVIAYHPIDNYEHSTFTIAISLSNTLRCVQPFTVTGQHILTLYTTHVWEKTNKTTACYLQTQHGRSGHVHCRQQYDRCPVRISISHCHSNPTWYSSVLPNYWSGHDRFLSHPFQFVIR